MKPTLLENYEELIVVEKDLRMIGVIKDDEPAKDSKYVSRNPQAILSKGKDKEASEIEALTHLVKKLTIEVFELKQQMVETSTSS